MDEIPKNNKCQYCGKEYKNKGAHERFCELNPANKASPETVHTKEAPKESIQESEKKEDHNPLIITDVQLLSNDGDNDYVAWFMDEQGNKSTKTPLYIGIIHNTTNQDQIPCILVQADDGMLVPPFLFAGFIGMFPQSQEFPEPEQTIHEPPPEEPPIEQTKPPSEPVKTELEGNTDKRIITAPENSPVLKKKSFLAGVFSKKPKKDTKGEVSNETKDLLREVAGSGGTV